MAPACSELRFQNRKPTTRPTSLNSLYSKPHRWIVLSEHANQVFFCYVCVVLRRGD